MLVDAHHEGLRGRGRARHLGRRAGRAFRSRWDVVLVVAAGGALGAAGRYGVGQALPRRPDEFPWATFLVNVTGCLALGLVMVLVTDVWTASRYGRAFLGVGVLGGYTTLSTYALESRDLLVAHQRLLGGLYLSSSVAAGLLAVWFGVVAGRLLVLGAGARRRRRVRRAHREGSQA